MTPLSDDISKLKELAGKALEPVSRIQTPLGNMSTEKERTNAAIENMFTDYGARLKLWAECKPELILRLCEFVEEATKVIQHYSEWDLLGARARELLKKWEGE